MSGNRNGRTQNVRPPPKILLDLSSRKIDCLRAALIVLHLEVDLLTFSQSAHSSLLDGGDVDEDVLATIIGSNETKTTGGVEEFYDTCRHYLLFQSS